MPRARRLSRATLGRGAQGFRAALEAVPGDGPSLALAQRVEDFQANPPPADWDGAWRLDQK
jgi:adenylate cyclase